MTESDANKLISDAEEFKGMDVLYQSKSYKFINSAKRGLGESSRKSFETFGQLKSEDGSELIRSIPIILRYFRDNEPII